MKTAISLDDQTFAEAEALAQKLRLTRSELYRAALREYLARHSGEDVTAALDRVYGAGGESEDDVRREAARRTFEANEW
ncbi:type II toxin-antitoxin system VapB family antitoxin [Deinococcus budaensis]|uniref:Arc/MetJ family transcription regulator n=1 Tax=Deinococcus budaensis TaxID=1665626 RepID=A0A7W8LRM7_9DEIO|nr:type II toxin-antitoxin system VapB family antitoxin [Deinococcus budaensis]MBB5236061.1 Arc/MetJ family transcription regulator [Deinococcus budaensis]